jgi:hypothetical protein
MFASHVGYSTSLMKPASRNLWTSRFCEGVNPELVFDNTFAYFCEVEGCLGEDIIVFIQE